MAEEKNTFVGLPIESLIAKPFVAAALSQQELNSIYVDTLMKLAYTSDDKKKTNTLDLELERPVIGDGTAKTITSTIKAPLLSLVPLPALTMDEMTVEFDMEVKANELSENKTHVDVGTTAGYKSWWGLDAKITGNVSSDSTHKRETDSSATYKIRARAIQQPAAEGMAKLTALLASAMEPINTDRPSGS